MKSIVIMLFVLPFLMHAAPRPHKVIVHNKQQRFIQLQRLLHKKIAALSTRRRRKDLDESTKVALVQFGNMANSFFNIFADKNNPQHVGKCVEGMLGGLIKMTVAGAQKHQENKQQGAQPIKRNK